MCVSTFREPLPFLLKHVTLHILSYVGFRSCESVYGRFESDVHEPSLLREAARRYLLEDNATQPDRCFHLGVELENARVERRHARIFTHLSAPKPFSHVFSGRQGFVARYQANKAS